MWLNARLMSSYRHEGVLRVSPVDAHRLHAEVVPSFRHIASFQFLCSCVRFSSRLSATSGCWVSSRKNRQPSCDEHPRRNNLVRIVGTPHAPECNGVCYGSSSLQCAFTECETESLCAASLLKKQARQCAVYVAHCCVKHLIHVSAQERAMDTHAVPGETPIEGQRELHGQVGTHCKHICSWPVVAPMYTGRLAAKQGVAGRRGHGENVKGVHTSIQPKPCFRSERRSRRKIFRSQTVAWPENM